MPSASTCPERGRARDATWLGVILVTAVSVCSHLLLAQSPGSTFRSRTELVVLQVSVVDPHGRFVPDLKVEDFSVYEEGRRQTVSLFASTSTPLDLMLLIDTSASMNGRIKFVQDAAMGLLRSLGRNDRAAIVLFNGTVQIAQELTGDLALLEKAVRSALPGGATAMYEATYIGLRELARARRDAGEVRRQGLVVLSDGDDNRSRVVVDDVVDEVRRRPTTIFTILPSLSPELLLQVPGVRSGTAYAMRQLAEESGGRMFTPTALTDLNGVYQDVAGELNQQYWLAYEPPPGLNNGFRRVSVRVETRAGLRARTRTGYYGARQETLGSPRGGTTR